MKMARLFLIVAAAIVFLMGTASLLKNPGQADNKGGTQVKELSQEPALAPIRPAPTPAVYEEGMLPIHAACRSGSVDAVRYLLDNGADPSARTESGWTAMHFAVQAGNTEIVRILVEKGCSISELTSDGLSPLTIAANAGNLELMSFLVSKGADVKK
jgi:ankyrin repeat protein